jgi:triosephosphate isomerase (TIM)
MARKPILIANWKMNKVNDDAAAFIMELKDRVRDISDRDIVLCPSFISVITAYDCCMGSNIRIGAQDMHYHQSGAYTGEVSAAMLRPFCDYVIIGHSERRKYFFETDELINHKVRAALAIPDKGLTPILCIGETAEERKANKTMEVLIRQLKKGLEGISAEDIKRVIIAYEPVWAISSGNPSHQPATPQTAQKEHHFIRQLLNSTHGGIGEEMRIIYGGSVKPANIADFMREKDIDGALVGNASLEAESFAGIVGY